MSLKYLGVVVNASVTHCFVSLHLNCIFPIFYTFASDDRKYQQVFCVTRGYTQHSNTIPAIRQQIARTVPMSDIYELCMNFILPRGHGSHQISLVPFLQHLASPRCSGLPCLPTPAASAHTAPPPWPRTAGRLERNHCGHGEAGKQPHSASVPFPGRQSILSSQKSEEQDVHVVSGCTR